MKELKDILQGDLEPDRLSQIHDLIESGNKSYMVRRLEELKTPKHVVCAYCKDTGWMTILTMRNKHRNEKCIWCKEGKDKLNARQLVDVSETWNRVIDEIIELVQQPPLPVKG